MGIWTWHLLEQHAMFRTKIAHCSNGLVDVLVGTLVGHSGNRILFFGKHQGVSSKGNYERAAAVFVTDKDA